MSASGDPYKVLGIGPEASDEQIRTAYRRLVQANHPDHNNGSPDSARRFEEIQEAYARVRRLRSDRPITQEAPVSADPALNARLAAMEQQVRDAQAARERAQREAARAAAASAERQRAGDEELGYVRTDDSFGKILEDAEQELRQRLARRRGS